MNFALASQMPLQSILWSNNPSLVKQVLFILSGVILLAIASQISIPLFPVPLTFQSTTVILIAMAYGARYGAYVVAVYLIAGFCGLPVFAGFSGGLAKLTGPTAGYLIGFLPAAWLSGWLAQKGFAKNSFRSFIAGSLGISIIFCCGVLVLAQSFSWQYALAFGLMPFIVSELIKLLAVSLLIPHLWKSVE